MIDDIQSKFHEVRGSMLFTASGMQYFHVFNISLCGKEPVNCANNISFALEGEPKSVRNPQYYCAWFIHFINGPSSFNGRCKRLSAEQRWFLHKVSAHPAKETVLYRLSPSLLVTTWLEWQPSRTWATLTFWTSSGTLNICMSFSALQRNLHIYILSQQ